MLIDNVTPLHSGLFLSAWTQFLKMGELFNPFLIVGFYKKARCVVISPKPSLNPINQPLASIIKRLTALN